MYVCGGFLGVFGGFFCLVYLFGLGFFWGLFQPKSFRFLHRKCKIFESGELAIYRTEQQTLTQKLAEAQRTVSVTILVHARRIMAKENTFQILQQATIWNNSCRGLQDKRCYISEVFFSGFQLIYIKL